MGQHSSHKEKDSTGKEVAILKLAGGILNCIGSGMRLLLSL